MVNESDLQPVTVSVNATLVVPAAIPVTIFPPAVILTIPAGVEVQVPPENGVNEVVEPIQMVEVPTIATVGGGLTVTGLVVA